MAQSPLDTLRTFTIDTIPDLDVAVLGALELFQQQPLPQIDLHTYKRPLVVGSGNAEATGRIIFRDVNAIFASESDFEERLKHFPDIDGVVVVSASGEKHAPIIVKVAGTYGKHVTLITNSPNSPAGQLLDHQHPYDEYVFPKNREPYTYNTSTYMGMILGSTGEDPAAIAKFIREKIDTIAFPDLASYDKFFLIIPPKFTAVIRMLNVKFIELFGRSVARDIETAEYLRHAATVVPTRELFIGFDYENNDWGAPEDRVHIPLPENANFAAMMAIGYYVIAQIQKSHPPHFKQNIVAYMDKVSRLYGEKLSPIVE